MADNDSELDPFSDKSFDQFWLNNVFPDAENLFAVKQKPLEEIKNVCLVALDANVLLLPYEMGAESFSKIAEIYKSLVNEDRLFVPAQAAREFVKNRASKLRDLTKQIGDQASTLNFSFHKEIGFLEKDTVFSDIKDQSEIIAAARAKLLTQIKELRRSLADNVGADPVSVVYQELMMKRVVSLPDSEQDRQKLSDEMKWRYKHKVPPGYKDGSKDDGGIGDFLIWKTILEEGKKRGFDCIFVTKDLKGDWWVQGQGAFQPRVELIEEYFRYTGGSTVHFLSLSSLLELLEVSAETVTDVKRVEANVVQQIIRSDIQPRLRQRSSPLSDDIPLNEVSLRDLARMRREIDQKILELHKEARPIRSTIENSELVESLDESTLLELFERDQDLRRQRSQLRSRDHQIHSEINRRASAQSGE
jgi:hypothetical protein